MNLILNTRLATNSLHERNSVLFCDIYIHFGHEPVGIQHCSAPQTFQNPPENPTPMHPTHATMHQPTLPFVSGPSTRACNAAVFCGFPLVPLLCVMHSVVVERAPCIRAAGLHPRDHAGTRTHSIYLRLAVLGGSVDGLDRRRGGEQCLCVCGCARVSAFLMIMMRLLGHTPAFNTKHIYTCAI